MSCCGFEDIVFLSLQEHMAGGAQQSKGWRPQSKGPAGDKAGGSNASRGQPPSFENAVSHQATVFYSTMQQLHLGSGSNPARNYHSMMLQQVRGLGHLLNLSELAVLVCNVQAAACCALASCFGISTMQYIKLMFGTYCKQLTGRSLLQI